MKILILVSSLRKHGNTGNLARLLEERLLKAGKRISVDIQVELLYLGDVEIKPCLGCRACFDKGESACPLKDGLAGTASKMQEADCVIAASPVYAEDVNGTMKSFIDRLAYNNHRPGFTEKTAFLLTTSGINSTNHSLKTMNRAFGAWGFNIAGQRKFRMGALMDPLDIEKSFGAEINRIAEKITAPATGKTAINPSFYSLMAFKVQQSYWQKTNGKDTLDYHFWNSKGWMEHSCQYYTQNAGNPVKIRLARLFGSIIALFFI